MLALLALIVSAPCIAATREEARVTPVQKVIQLMEGMVAKGKKEKTQEQVQFAAFKTFCDNTNSQKQTAIKEANEQMEVLKADIEKAESDAATLTEEIAQHDEDIATWNGDLKASTKVREIENEDYLAAHKDYTESIQAIEDGIAELKGQAHDVSQVEDQAQAVEGKEEPKAEEGNKEEKAGEVVEEQAQESQEKFVEDVQALELKEEPKAAEPYGPPQLVQKGSALKRVSGMYVIPAETKRALDAFLSRDSEADENLAVGAPEANAFEFQSQGLVDMLEKLQAKFIDERTAMEDMETNAKHAYEMLTQDLKHQIDKATEDRTEKSEFKAKALQAAADGKGDNEATTATRDEDTKYLNDLTATCEQKAAAFAERQTLRAEEIEAIQKAIEIIAGGAVSGAAGKHLPKLVQMKTSSLAQLRAGTENPTQLRVAVFLKNQAGKLNSRVLSVLATRVTADPMKKIKKMIKDLIVKLMEEAQQEAEQKGFCDAEMATNEQTRTEKAAAVETLSAEIDELTASVAKLTEEITDLTAQVAGLGEAAAKATSIREEEKLKNAATIKDAQEAQTAVAQALAVLKDFYDKAAKATSFVQQQPVAPAIFDEEPYKGMGAENGGVVGMVEVIQSDFARLEAETTAAESENQKEYDQFMADTEIDKTSKTSDIEFKTTTKQNQEASLEEKKVDLEGTQKELATAMAYWEKLKPQCMDAVESYEDRVARRKAEIESLQEALKILTE